jgi:hypothetical protein
VEAKINISKDGAISYHEYNYPSHHRDHQDHPKIVLKRRHHCIAKGLCQRSDGLQETTKKTEGLLEVEGFQLKVMPRQLRRNYQHACSGSGTSAAEPEGAWGRRSSE